jgi:hypothetical protein
MFKSIPKSNISNRSFKVYKLWSEQTQEHAPLIKLYDVSGSYFDDSNPKSQGYYINSLYNSIKNKYYSTDGNAFTTFGSSQNLANHIRERDYQNNLIYAFSVQRSKFGEQIKPNSTTLTIGEVEYTDDEFTKNYKSGIKMANVPGLTIDSLVKMFCDKPGQEDLKGKYSTIKQYWSEMDESFFISFAKKLLEIYKIGTDADLTSKWHDYKGPDLQENNLGYKGSELVGFDFT